MANVWERLVEVIEEQLGAEVEITKETKFEQDLGADSLDSVELVMAIEEEFDIEINDDDAEHLETVQQLYDYVLKCIDE